MKSNFFKYTFIIFVVCIIIGAIYFLYFRNSTEKNETIEEPKEEITQIKELRLGISNFDTINPLRTSNKEVLNIDRLIFEPLISIDENYKTSLCLATECSKTSPNTYVIKIDNNTKWQDGTPLIAKDIQFTIDRLKEVKSIYSHNVEKITSVEILDSDKVKITLSEEIPFFEYNLSFPILPNNYYLNEDFNISTKVPIGTGMFYISSIENGNITLKKNDRWRNKENQNSKIETINIKLFSQIGELYNSFKLGNIDIFTTSNINLEQYIGTIGYAKQEFKGREFDYLAFNCENNILKSVEVRQAISYAIDRTNIVSSVYSNQVFLSDFPLDYRSYLYEENTKSNEYNLEQTKKILTDNSWEYKNNKWQKTENYRTTRLELDLTVNSANSNRVLVAENIKEQLAQIGIKVTINKVSDANYKKILENKSYEMILTGVYNSYSPNLNTFFGNNNLQNYGNQEINTLLNEINNIKDENTLKEKYKRIIQLYNEEKPFISLYRNKATVVKNQSLAGELKPNNYFSYYRLYDWYRM